MSSYDDDGYDDDIDEEYPEPGYVGDAETLLRRTMDIVATAPTMPLSSSPRIDRDEIIELLEEALQPSCRRAPPGAVDAQGAPGVRRQDAPRGRRAARGGTGAGRADGAAHRGRARRRAAGPPGHGDRRERRATTQARDRGLPRPAARELRDPPRQACRRRWRAGRQKLAIGQCRRTRRHDSTKTIPPRDSSIRTTDSRRCLRGRRCTPPVAPQRGRAAPPARRGP
jgi:hypothetical protein